jgi:mono/diheme cytochrome c family protein
MLSALISLAACAAPAPDAPIAPQSAALTPAQARGQQVYERWCAPCHDPGSEHPGTLAIGVKYEGARPASILDWTDLAPETTRLVVRSGMYSMPFFRETEISDAELDDLAAYLARNTP